MLKAIVFDMDDTLYPESAYVRSGFRAVADWAAGRYAWEAEASYAALNALFEAGVRGDTFNRWLAAQNADESMVQDCLQVYRAHTPTLTPYDDIPLLLRALKPHYKLGLVSDGYLAVQQAKFAALALGEWFDAVVFSDQWGREHWKPSTRPFEAVLALLGVAAEEAVYIGDNPKKDFLGARQIGMKTLWYKPAAAGIYDAHTPPTPDHAAHLTLASYQDLMHTLQQLIHNSSTDGERSAR